MNQWRGNEMETESFLGQDTGTGTGTEHDGFAELSSSVNTHINIETSNHWSRGLSLLCRVLVLIAGFTIACCLSGLAFILAIFSAFAFDSGSERTAMSIACFQILYAILLLFIALAIFICSVLFAMNKIGFPTFRRVMLRILAFCIVTALLQIPISLLFPIAGLGVWWFDFWLVRIYLPMHLSWKFLQKRYWGGETVLNVLLDRRTVDNSNFETSHPVVEIEVGGYSTQYYTSLKDDGPEASV